MAKGAEAKNNVTLKIQEAFGAAFIGVVDKKIYVLTEEGGEPVQVAIAMTCPKVPIETGAVPIPGQAVTVAAAAAVTTDFDIPDAEIKRVAEVLKEMGVE